jgi:putative tricarboxylic transport membrane protein
VHRTDRRVGIGIALLAIAVLWTARGFPDVPGQKLGASSLPMIVGAGLLVCGVLLALRGRRAGPAREERPRERVGPAVAIIAAIVLYLVASEPIGYPIVAPLTLLIALLGLGSRPLPAIAWSIGAAAAVHLAFYKLLKVPLPWGLLPPLY